MIFMKIILLSNLLSFAVSWLFPNFDQFKRLIQSVHKDLKWWPCWAQTQHTNKYDMTISRLIIFYPATKPALANPILVFSLIQKNTTHFARLQIIYFHSEMPVLSLPPKKFYHPGQTKAIAWTKFSCLIFFLGITASSRLSLVLSLDTSWKQTTPVLHVLL